MPRSRAQAAVAARVRGAHALGLLAPAGAADVPAVHLADPAWTAEVLARRARVQRSADLRVLATLWWYSASWALLTPPLAGLVTGIPLSARLPDLSVAVLPGVRPVAAEAAGAGSGDVAADLRDSLGAVTAAVAEAGRMRARPLWAIATDSLADRLLQLGLATGDPGAATALAAPLAAGIGAPLPAPRFEDVAGRRFVRRASCCLLDRTPGMPACTSCPRRPPAERRLLLERVARPAG
ncbi:(2Fe-2S)-binding protein [Blastococcus tunisiensis]|uniref:FhuF 2Fe-2S C-terminal domain-containing protein n=1 Tax=Blastococcus tunisiensis TaxID=1798228 RepID=A0A1I1XLR9_9ACTN|nr:(2Fe-2S)-binding protein [Blastococcus sp. DSM 46838]SFE08369.1 FhuF 2Fe-2S C-terminal domain-containing protein [Blastococcus sp. DSM 46838]